MPSTTPLPESSALAKRERQVMDILYRKHEATVAEIMVDLPDPPSYSAVRSILRTIRRARQGGQSHA